MSTGNRLYKCTARHPGRPRADITAILALAKLYPDDENTLYYVSAAYEHEKNWTKAIEWIQKSHDAGLSGRGKSKFDALLTPKDLREEKISRDMRFHEQRGYYECMIGDNDKALKDLSAAIADGPNYLMNYRNRASLYKKLGRESEMKKGSR